jgi:hypothetical protein
MGTTKRSRMKIFPRTKNQNEERRILKAFKRGKSKLLPVPEA